MSRSEASNHNWYIDRNNIAIVKVQNSNVTNVSSYKSPAGGKTITVHHVKNDNEYTTGNGTTANKIDDGDSPSFETRFHRALAYHVIAHIFEIQASATEDPVLLNFANLWRAKYDDMVRKAKRIGNGERLSSETGYTIIPSDAFLF
tara:strand:+ start:8299 stop:8736 length:438 start_codon:yes stop_codon:yes gene_type:complete